MSAGPDVDLPVLLPGVPVFVRPDTRVQAGCGPDTAVVLPIPTGVDVRGAVAAIRLLRTPRNYRSISRRVLAVGLTAQSFRAIADVLVRAGKAAPVASAPPAPIPVRIVGCGDVAHALAATLTADGHPTTGGAGLVVIADQPIADPTLTTVLMERQTPHLPVHLRDGIGVVGPLVLPGSTPCLTCVDLHRTDVDPCWPLIAARLNGVESHGSVATLRSTVALAHGIIDEIAEHLRVRDTRLPNAVGRTFEFRSDPVQLKSHVIDVHPRCGNHMMRLTRELLS